MMPVPEKSSRRKKGKKSKSENVAGKFGQVQSKELADNLGLDNLVSDAGGASSIDDGDDAGAPAAVAVLEEDDMPLMKEVDHIPMIKERLLEDKISHVLSASARGDEAMLESILGAGDITISSKDQSGRTPLHVAASEGHVRLVE